MKIVINTEHGGFGLSESAQRRYMELIGKNPDDYYKFKHWYELDRTDKALVQAVEELGESANDLISHLEVVELDPGTQYRISSFDGKETLECRYLTDDWMLAID